MPSISDSPAAPSQLRAIREVHGLTPQTLTDDLLASTEPLILRGLVSEWPATQAGLRSAADGDAYLRQFYRDATVNAMLGTPEIKGRFFYNEDVTGFNFFTTRARLDAVLAEMRDHLDDEQPPAIYVGSTTIETALPGFREANDLQLGARDPLASIWIGNRSRIAAHYDLPDNIACVVMGRRRFTLFPPEQLANLYVGPLDFTPAGQAISMVDFHQPDLQRFPRFAEALRHAHVAEMEPGDALFIPSMWWHHVEALDRFNVLVNYWWRQAPGYMDTPTNALMLAVLTMRGLPPEQRAAWQEIFRHYIFEPSEESLAHIPPHARHALAPLTEDGARVLRGQLLKRLNR
ncbi:cupin-like domain-containing protein [Massilia arenosa]|uniref:Cupin-like domain-containing protein n=1 Tax=Zemynaea arenosa TaxID=2561931 RepID=A0A4Y9SDC1_9BURK|nr:cupin-like domain-containing protein [Massilia arenosa]TFW20370.1 cupin-like domain-containing protein [Massilia arenosa]